MADLAKHVDDALGRHRAEALDQRIGVESVEQLHHIVERAVLGDAEVEQRRRCGVIAAARSPAPRARTAGPRRPKPPAGRPHRAGRISLIAAGAGEHPVPRPPDLAHPSFAELLLEPVASQLARAVTSVPRL